jgi:hypothetical protein
MPLGDSRDCGTPNDPNVKVGQIYIYSAGYFKVTSVSGGFASIRYSGSNKDDMVLRNTFASNIAEKHIRLIESEAELAHALLLFSGL